jgi:hypothetical protein
MKMRSAGGIALAMVAVLGVTGCVSTQSRFEWGAYEPALYIYSKKPDKRPQYEKALVEAIDRGRKSNKVAPGLLAELGYLRMEEGDTKAAISLFQEEMALFPESRPFLTGIVAKLEGQSGSGATKPQGGSQ